MNQLQSSHWQSNRGSFGQHKSPNRSWVEFTGFIQQKIYTCNSRAFYDRGIFMSRNAWRIISFLAWQFVASGFTALCDVASARLDIPHSEWIQRNEMGIIPFWCLNTCANGLRHDFCKVFSHWMWRLSREPNQYTKMEAVQPASCQIRKIAGCACGGNAGNVFPATTG